MSLTDMQIFVNAAESRTLTEAAERLSLPVSTICRAVKRIQANAKLVLLRRSADGLHLTPAGKDYWEACRRTLAAYQETLDILDTHRGQPQGKLHIYAPITFARSVLAPVLPRFRELYPKIHLELSLYCSNWHQEPSAEFDIFLKVRDPKDSRHHIKIFPPIRQGVFASATYLNGHERPAHPADLHKHQCIGYSSDRRQVPWKLTGEGEEVVVEPAFQIVVGDPDIQLDLTLSGLGVALLPLWVAHAATQRGELVRLLPQWTPEPIPFCALYRGRSRTSPKSEAFLCFLEHVVGQNGDPRLNGGEPSDFFGLRS